ncbi:MAG: type II toxin-antitoxin system HicA family toxin [Desulfobacteraceae bacterium]|nr:type II toxin-antitoxin system HicA family toxin [Desulfobacteraceae bacterium]
MKIFEKFGCAYIRKKGSHHIFVCPNAKRAVVIPEYDEVDVDIIKNNMRTVGMSREQYFEMLAKVLFWQAFSPSETENPISKKRGKQWRAG